MAANRPQTRGSIIDAKDLRFILRIVAKNWYFVVVALVLSAVLSYLYSYKLPDVYGASTQILLKDREVYNYQTQMHTNIGYIGVYGDIVNQKRVLTSYDLINETLDKLDFDVSYYIVGRFKTSPVYGTLPFTVNVDLLNQRLYEKPIDLRIVDHGTFEVSYDMDGEIRRKIFPFNEWARDKDMVIRVDLASYVREDAMADYTATDYQFIRHSRNSMVGRYKNLIQVANHDFTTILQVTVEDEVATRAKMFLDSLSLVYINYTLQSEIDINENTLVYIDRQLEEVSAILEIHEDEQEAYLVNNDILNLGREESLYFEELLSYDNQRRRLEIDLQGLDALEQYVINSDEEELLPPAVYIMDDGFLRGALGELYGMQLERNRMLFDGTEESPAILRFDEVAQMNRGNLLLYIKNSRAALLSRMDDYTAQIKDYEAMLRQVPKNQRDLVNIKRRLQVNEKMYLFLLEKRANTVIARAGIIPQTKVIESARSIGVVRPDKTRILYTFLMGGVLVSFIVVFVRIMFYDRIENAEQLKEITTLPVYGEIIASEKAEENYVVVDSDPKAAITESFRTVRTNLEYIPGEEGKGKVVMVTSYRPNEGKTFCSVNLACILAKAGKRVLLLELDLHKPKVAVGLGMSSTSGLSNVLVGRVPWREAVLPTQFDNLSVMLAGPTPPNASELVLSKHLVQIFDEARDLYDYVVVDTPPVGLITDALLMMRHTDATLFVVNTRFANKDHVTNAMEVLGQNAGRNSGFILNGVRMKKSKYYYNTNYGYGYRYAYGYGSGYGYGYGYGRKRRGKEKSDGSKPDARD